jgi:hypothetical protein
VPEVLVRRIEKLAIVGLGAEDCYSHEGSLRAAVGSSALLLSTNAVLLLLRNRRRPPDREPASSCNGRLTPDFSVAGISLRE